MPSLSEKGNVFRELHRQDHAFLVPNPWDAGTARLLVNLGFKALATTSGGFALSAGQRDGDLALDATIAHIASIASAVPVPVSADLQNGFDDVAESIRLAAAAGAVGGSIEDATGRKDNPLYDARHAAERVLAASEAAHALPHSFTITARAENYLYGHPNLRDTIARLQAYQEAGADVLYAPGLRTREEIQQVVKSVDRPLNVLAGLPGFTLALAELSELGVRRVSVGSALARVAMGAFLHAAREMKSQGTFAFAEQAISSTDLNALLAESVRSRD